MGTELSWGLLADQSESQQKYMGSASRKYTAQFQGLAIISHLIHLLGSKNDNENVESSSCSKEGCLQSIERLKAQPASRQWDSVSSKLQSLAQRKSFTQCFYEHYGDVLHLFMCKH